MASSSESLSILKELFPDWSTEDLTSCLEESRGELDTAITRISEGHATKFGEVTKKKEKAPKRVEYGNGRGRGRGASTGAPRGRSEFRGRGRGRGASTSTGPTDRTAVETTPSWAENAETTQTSTLPAWATEDAATKSASQELPQSTESRSEEPVAQAATTGLFSAPPKPKARIVDKNSTSSWASVARPVAPAQPATTQSRPPPQSTAPEKSANKLSVDDETAPLTEENLEAVTEDQLNVPQPPTATVASLQGEPATGPPSVAGTSQTGPPGLKSNQQNSAARVSTPIGGRRLNQNEAVVMPGSEREPTARLGVQFGSLGLGDEEVYNDKNNVLPQQQKLETPDLRSESNSQQSRQDRPQETYGAYGAQGGPLQQQQQHHQQQQQQPYAGQTQEQYSSMANFYGQNDQARASPFGAHNDYYGQHTSQQPTQPPYGLQSGASQRSDTTSRPTDPASRFGEPASSPMTSMTSQPPHSSASPAPSHPGGQHQQQQHQQSQFPMHPQYGAPNPYAYYGYGYGYPQQQQHSAYGGQMYGQQQQRGGYGVQGHQYPGAPVSHQPVGTSQDRFERSTAEYQRQQQQTQYPQSGFGNNDFLGSSRNQQQSSESLDPFKGYNSNQGSTTTREDTKPAPTGFGSQAGFGQQTPSGSQYGSHASGQYGEQQGQQNQFSQYGSYGRQSGHQQYGGQWNQY